MLSPYLPSLGGITGHRGFSVVFWLFTDSSGLVAEGAGILDVFRPA